MPRKRERKHPHIEVSGVVPLDECLARRETELILAALTRLASTIAPTTPRRPMPPQSDRRSAWVSYLRVSTPEQAERDLSVPAQRHAVADYAATHGATMATATATVRTRCTSWSASSSTTTAPSSCRDPRRPSRKRTCPNGAGATFVGRWSISNEKRGLAGAALSLTTVTRLLQLLDSNQRPGG